jgi:hypothetical protein
MVVSRRSRSAIRTFRLSPLRHRVNCSRAKESLAVRIIGEDGLAAIAAVHDVIDGTRIFQAQLASHADSVPGKEAIGQ